MSPQFVNFLRDFLSQRHILITPVYEPLGDDFPPRGPSAQRTEGDVNRNVCQHLICITCAQKMEHGMLLSGIQLSDVSCLMTYLLLIERHELCTMWM